MLSIYRNIPFIVDLYTVTVDVFGQVYSSIQVFWYIALKAFLFPYEAIHEPNRTARRREDRMAFVPWAAELRTGWGFSREKNMEIPKVSHRGIFNMFQYEVMIVYDD